MAIDVLSRSGAVPIIVGDDAEISEIRAVNTDPDGAVCLLLDDQEVPLSDPACENLRTATHLLLVGITGADNITTARRVRIDNISEGGEELSRDQRRTLGKALSLGAGGSQEFQAGALDEFWQTYPELSAA